MNKTILLGLNELNFEYIKLYVNQGLLPNFKKIFEIQPPIETVLINILDNYENNLIDVNEYKSFMKEIANRRYKWNIITENYSEIFK